MTPIPAHGTPAAPVGQGAGFALPVYAERWGEECAARGFLGTPISVKDCQVQLGLTEGEMSVLDRLFRHWGEGGDPFPSSAAIGARIGVDPSTVRHRLA